jgi:hypothetical protein
MRVLFSLIGHVKYFYFVLLRRVGVRVFLLTFYSIVGRFTLTRLPEDLDRWNGVWVKVVAMGVDLKLKGWDKKLREGFLCDD